MIQRFLANQQLNKEQTTAEIKVMKHILASNEDPKNRLAVLSELINIIGTRT